MLLRLFNAFLTNSSELMEQCWENKPGNRPSFANIVKMLSDYVINERNFQVKYYFSKS